MNGDPLPRLRALCLALPEVTEKVSHGEPTWFVRKVFVSYADHHHDERVAFWCAAPPGAQEALVAARPDRFFRPPYVGGRGWLGVWLDVGRDCGDPDRADPDRAGPDRAGLDRADLDRADLDWDEIAEIVTDAYRVIAPKKLVAQLDA